MSKPEFVVIDKGFNGLLIGQGTAGIGTDLVRNVVARVSMASSSAKALPVQAGG